LFIFRKPENEEKKKNFKLSIKWWDEQPLIEKSAPPQETRLVHATDAIGEIETKLNPYGFIYLPKKSLTSLPFKPGDKLRLKVDSSNMRVVITPE
jgi:hypothetical protein